MIKVYPLSDVTLPHFEKLFTAYYNELDCGEDIRHLLDEYIVPDIKAGLVRCELINDENGTPCGFVLYQKDGIENEWCLREGWGDIREIYITAPARKKGLGKFLLYTAELKLMESGAKSALALPCEGATEFFKACGYSDSGERNDDLDCPVYVKAALGGGCERCK